MNVELAELILQHFNGRENYIAVDSGNGFNPVERGVTARAFAESHLDGKKCLGFYPLRSDSTVTCTCLDFDNHTGDNSQVFVDAAKAAKFLHENGLSPLVERSQSGNGCHVWLLFDKPIDATIVVSFWKAVLKLAGLPEKTEHYPRQSNLQLVKKGLGNLIRYPLWKVSRFIDWTKIGNVADPFDALDPFDTLKTYKCVTQDELENCLNVWNIEVEQSTTNDAIEHDVPARVRTLLTENATSILGRRWMCDTGGMIDGTNSAILMALAVELVRAYVPSWEIEAALLYWCKQNKYEKGERLDYLRTTIEKAYSMAVNRREVRSLVGNTFATLAHDYADLVLKNEELVISSGTPLIDEAFGGFRTSELTIVSGRSNHGKTATAMNFLDAAALSGNATLLISLEMSAKENSNRVLCSVTGLSESDRKTDEGNALIHELLKEHYSKRAPMYFVEDAFHIDRIDDLIDQYSFDHKVKTVVLDYQGLVETGDRDERVAQSVISKRLKKAAKRNDIHVISLVQMNRNTEYRKSRSKGDFDIPQMSDLKGSGAIENDADNILFCVWPWKDDPNRPKHEYVISVAKVRNRGLKTPLIPLYFDCNKQRFN